MTTTATPTRADLLKAARACGAKTTGTTAEIKAGIATQLGYNATEDKGRRQAPLKRIRHESLVLTPPKRLRLQATAEDQLRNHSLPAWMVRKHLDYVSKFHVSIRTGKDAMDSLLKRLLRWHGAPNNLDIAGRLGRDEMFRMFESEKVVKGDAGLIELPDLKLQGLESDLIALPSDYRPDKNGNAVVNSQGLVVDETGRRLQFCICNRTGGNGGIKFDHLESADNVNFDGYWTRFTSQFRGVSPLSTAINMIQDIHSGFEFNAVKAAMHALFGIAIMRDAGIDGGMGGAAGATSETAGAASTATGLENDLNPRAVNIIDLNPGESVSTIESGTPSIEFVQGSYLFIQIAMLALDIPVTAFDSRRSSFSARIADLNEYEVSVDGKRTKHRYVRQRYSDWLLRTIWNTPADPWRLQTVATANGMNLRDVQEAVEWIPAGSPWLDKKKQVEGDGLAISLRLDNPIDAARRRGTDVFQNIDKQLEVEEYERTKRTEKGLTAPVADAPSPDDNVQAAVKSAVTEAMNERDDDTARDDT